MPNYHTVWNRVQQHFPQFSGESESVDGKEIEAILLEKMKIPTLKYEDL